MADERDPKVSQRYRELGSEEPPRELDQAILAAARRVRRQRWYYVFGAAAIMVLAVAVTVQIDRQRSDSEFVPDAPVPLEQPKAESGSAARDAAPETGAQAPQKQEAGTGSVSRPMAAPAAPAESRSKENALGAAVSRQEQTAEAQKPEARADSAPGSMAAPAARARMAERTAESPERWLERIVQLRKEGRHEEADKQLAEFRKRYPEYKVPESALK
jgi:hypothetical protein